LVEFRMAQMSMTRVEGLTIDQRKWREHHVDRAFRRHMATLSMLVTVRKLGVPAYQASQIEVEARRGEVPAPVPARVPARVGDDGPSDRPCLACRTRADRVKADERRAGGPKRVGMARSRPGSMPPRRSGELATKPRI
jgi:hypothetical protein